jgi:DNA-binding MarR family transcriptional regulator
VPSPSDPELSRAALNRLDKIFEHRVRLAVCVLLSRSDGITFRHFKDLLEETDGNLGAQLRRLEDEGYVSASKRFVHRKPVTWYRLTPAGRRALRAHVEALDVLLREPAG